MDEIDILLAVAEIGVVVAGFASLATVVGHSYRNTDPRVTSIRLRGLLDTSLSTTLLALIAVLLLKVEGLGTWVWRGSSILGLLVTVSVGWAAVKRGIHLSNLPGYRKPLALVLYSILGVVFLGFAINSAGLTGIFGFHVYLGMLILSLVICFTWFVLVIVSLLGPDSERGSKTEG